MSSRTPKTLSSEARRLHALLTLNELDGFLQMLVGLGSGPNFSIDLPVNLAVNGLLIRGRLSPPEDFAQVLDGYMNRVVRSADFQYRNVSEEQTQDDEAIRRAVAVSLSDAFVKRVERRRTLEERGRQVTEQAWGEPSLRSDNFVPRVDDLPDEGFEDALAALSPDLVITLRGGEILVPGSSQWTPVGYVRVLARHVSAWWLGSADSPTLDTEP